MKDVIIYIKYMLIEMLRRHEEKGKEHGRL